MKTKSKKQKENLRKILSKMSAIGLKVDNLLKAQEIVEVMKKYKFSVADVRDAEVETNGFDLLCVEYDIYKRVPFEEGKKLYPIGIFPYPSSNVYISLAEHEWPRKDCDKDNLPTYDFFFHLLPMMDQLNHCLRELGKPVIDGCYYAKDFGDPDCNYIAGVGGRFGNSVGWDYYGDNERAKYRAVKVFKQ